QGGRRQDSRRAGRARERFPLELGGRPLVVCAFSAKHPQMNPLKALTTPEYLFRPRQIAHRFKRAFRRRPLNEFELVHLPWGAAIRVRPAEVIGSNIWCYGVFDLSV